jgi:4-hydroxybenzoate polyprenyltransferase
MKLKEWIGFLRVQQYYKNILIFIAAFVAGEIFKSFFILLLGFLALCMISSASYILNDLKDIERDKTHNEKKNRPIASGKISKTKALIIMILLILFSFLIGFYIKNFFVFFLAFIFINSALYTFYLKKIVILDVHSISLNYIARAVSGGMIIEAHISPWFLLFIFILALFLVFSKRRSELELKQEYLLKYDQKFLEWAIVILLSVALVCYTLYTFFVYNNYYMMLTIPVVTFMVFRYLYLVSMNHKIGRKTELFFVDFPLLIAWILWLSLSFLIIYII